MRRTIAATSSPNPHPASSAAAAFSSASRFSRARLAAASPHAAVFVGAHRRAEAVLVSVEQYEALQQAAERHHTVAAALASVRAEGLEPGAEDLALFAEMAAGRLSTDELRERLLSRYRR